MKIPLHEATTAQLGAAYPFVSSTELPTDRVLIGRDIYGAFFAYDPFDLYNAGILTNPNMVVLGQVGRGKSALIKTYLYRQFAFGRRIVLIDPKGEYGDFADALGASIIRLEAGGAVSLNPLAQISNGAPPELERVRQQSILNAICAVSLDRPLSPGESVALQSALSAVHDQHIEPTLAAVVAELFQPQLRAATALYIGVEELITEGRAPGFALQRLLGGEFVGMFDGQKSHKVDLGSDIVVLDVSKFYRSDALAILLVCVFGALQDSLLRATSPTLCVLDEAWAVLANPYAAIFMQSMFKLARSFGVANVLVAHRPSDLVSSSTGIDRRALHVQGLLSDCETTVCYAQSPQEMDLAQRLFDLNDRQVGLLTQLGRGVALWKVAQHKFLVQHRLGMKELPFVDTDERMRIA